MGSGKTGKDLPITEVCGGEEGAAVRELMTKIGDKWSILLVVSLSKCPKNRARFSYLEKTIPGISQRMLTLTLRHLERDGLIKREIFPQVPPRVEYELTALGRSLLEPMQAIINWVGRYWNEVKDARAAYGEDRQ